MADPTISKPFQLDEQPSAEYEGTYTVTVTDGEISAIEVLNTGNGLYRPVKPGTDLFKAISESDTALDTISINETGQTGNVTETVLQDREQLDQTYDTLNKTYENAKIDLNETREEVLSTATVSEDNPTPGKPETMRYPYDIDIAQDHLTIKQYEYKRKVGGELLVNESGPGGSVAGSDYGMSQKKQPFGKFKGGVILPMPKVSDSNGAEWGKSDLNVLGIAAAGLAGGAMNAMTNPTNMLGQLRDKVFNQVSPKGDNELANQQSLIEGLLRKQGDITGEGDETTIVQETGLAGKSIAVSKLAGVAGIDISADELLARSTGSILNPNAELLFQGPVLRDFGFKFLMVARSEAEAKMIRRIIRFFKIGAAPIDLGGPALLRTPNVFQLEYKAGKNSLETVNKFNEMALRTITVDYAPDGFWTAYQDSHPVAVVMSLQFSELRPVYQTEHRNNTSEDSVGY